tara:strand:+ start:208 stop:789 length:582 start_codon:yes stop_codon:yes gene_type:complete
MILIIDNYDSFTYNLVQYIGSLNYPIKVVKNDEISIDEIDNINPDKIVISPGPGTPQNAGISIGVIKKYYQQIPILGICLGHQAIAISFGGRVINSNEISHGKVVKINHNQSQIFQNIPSNFMATRYHSLIIEEESLPEDINVIAKTDNNIIMGVEHKLYSLFGLQFHPESIETEFGMEMIKNFLKIENKNYK